MTSNQVYLELKETFYTYIYLLLFNMHIKLVILQRNIPIFFKILGFLLIPVSSLNNKFNTYIYMYLLYFQWLVLYF